MAQPRQPFIAVSPTLTQNRKFRKLARIFGDAMESTLVGHLVILWSAVFHQAPSGDLSAWESDDVEEAAGWTGRAGAFHAGLVSAGFLTSAGKVHDWAERGGYLCEVRAANARKANDFRERSVPRKKSSRHRDVTSGHRDVTSPHGDVTVTSPGADKELGDVTVTGNQTKPNQTKQKEGGKNTRFAPPSVDEVKAHVREKGFRFDPEAFWAFYESKGWKVGDAPMKSWQAACVTWQTRHAEKSPAATAPAGRALSDEENRRRVEAAHGVVADSR